MKPQYIYINEDGDKFYYNDKAMKIRHREDGPAVEWRNGHKEWFLNGILHREDGPAIEYKSGVKSWYLNDVKLSEQEFLKRTAKETILTMDEIASKFGIETSKLKIQK
jgi:hypothetical protein